MKILYKMRTLCLEDDCDYDRAINVEIPPMQSKTPRRVRATQIMLSSLATTNFDHKHLRKEHAMKFTFEQSNVKEKKND